MWSTPQEDKACTHEMQKNKLGCSKKPWTEIRTAPFYLRRYSNFQLILEIGLPNTKYLI